MMMRNPLQFVPFSYYLVVALLSSSSTTTTAFVLPYSSSSSSSHHQLGRRAAFGIRSEAVIRSRRMTPQSRLAFQRDTNNYNHNNADTATTSAFFATSSTRAVSTTSRFRSSNDTDDAPWTLTLPDWSPTGVTRQPHQDETKTPTPYVVHNNVMNSNHNQQQTTTKTALTVAAAVVTMAALLAAVTGGGLPSPLSFMGDTVPAFLQNLVAHPQETLQAVIDSIRDMGPVGLLYFGILYTLAEILAVPATPLTLSAGYLFGMVQGTGVVLLSATVAASVAFLIGKTFLRTWVEGVLEENPKFAKLDRAVGEQGFKLLFLVRLSPLFPFALSNYLYGASSIDFASYFWGTILGFTPGTIAYVYTGMVGQALMLGQEGAQPWYIYAGGLGLLAGLLKLVSDVASNIIESLDDEDEK